MQAGDVVMSAPGADFLIRQMQQIRTANGDVIQLMRQLEGSQWNMVAISNIEQVQQNLEGLRIEAERRTNILATGLTTAVAGIDQLREAAVQSNQVYDLLGQRVTELTEGVKHLVQRVDGIEGQVFLHEAMSQRLNELNDRVLRLESLGLASGDAERETFMKQNKLESDKLWLRILDLQEVVQKLESRPRVDESERSKELASVMARIVETERICKQLRARDEEIQGHLSHILSRETKTDPPVPERAHEVQDNGPSGVQTFNMASGTPLQDEADDDRDQWWDAFDEKPIKDWFGNPPGLTNGTWAPSAPPPALPREFVRADTSLTVGQALQLEPKDLRVQGGQWKLMKEFPKILDPRGQAWERGLQFSQYATEMVSVASCIGTGFGKFVRHQIDTALGRFQRRMDAGVPDPDVPPVASGCEEFESRLAMTLLSQTSDDIKRGVIESAAGQVVPSLTILEAILERYQPGGIEEKSSLTSFLRNLPQAGTFTECLATLRRLKLATSRILVLGLPSHPPHEAISSLNNMVRTLEKKSPTLSTRLNLLRLRPEILNPTEEGVSLLQTAIEAEARRLAAEEFSKPHHAKGDTKFTPCAFFNTERGNSSPSELSELDSVESGDSTPSEFGDESQEESDDDQVAWIWSLRLTGLEWRMWTSPGNIVIKAHAEFEHIDDYHRVEHGAWHLQRAGQLDELPAVLNDEWTVTAVHTVWALDPVTRVFKRAEAFELERVDDQSKLRFVVAVERNRPYVEPWTEDAWVSECLRFGFGAPNAFIQERIPLESMLIGHGFDHLAEVLGLLGAEYADDLTVLGPQDLIDNGVPRQIAEDFFQHGGVMSEAYTPIGAQRFRMNEDRIEELAFSLYASWQAGDPVSDEEYNAEVQQRFHGMIRRRRQGAANMCCVSGNRAESDGFVLVDSGANEVLRPQTKQQPAVDEKTLQVTLASGSHCTATLNKHGEVCMISENGAKGEWIVGVRKIIDIGGAFNWDQKGARISYPHPFEHGRIVTVDCIVTNGLPYMRWSDFKLARIALSKHYRKQQKGTCSHKATACNPEEPSIPPESQVVDWVDVLEFQEDAVRKACREGLYDKKNHASIQARGHRRPHRKLSAKDVSDGVISIDLSGPHKQSFAGNRYALVACAHIAEGLDLPFVRGIRTKEAAVVTEALRDILNQLVSMAEGQQITFRIHSDQGREFTARLSAEQLKTYNHYRTFAVPYSHQSNGRVENLIDQLKTSTASMLLGGKLDLRFWDELMVHAAKLRRMRALNMKIPRDLPAPGDYVLSRLPRDQMPDFRDRTEPGIFLGLSEHVANGSKVLVERDGRVLVRYARLPILLDKEKPRWRLVENPGSDQKTWISDKGQIAWAAPSDADILTMEEKLGYHIASPDEVFVKLNNLLEKTRGSEVEKEIFNLFSHGIIAQLPEVAEAHMLRMQNINEETQEEPKPEDEPEDSFGHKFMKAVASRAVSAPVDCAPDKSEKYITRTEEDERETDEIFQSLLHEAQQRRGSAEVVPNSVLTGEHAEQWIGAVRKEMTSVETKEVLMPIRVGHEREDLQLKDDEEIPRTIPMKLVLSEKPVEPGSTEKGIDNQGFLAKARLVACGNFQNNEFAKDELSTENVPSWIVRTMYHKLAQEPMWVAGAADISTAFLNTELRRGEAPLLDPPAVMKKLGLVEKGVKFLPLKALYGLRISPKEWAKDRDSTLNGSVLEPREGDKMPAARLEPLDICEGLWRLVNVASGEVMGLLTLYVDDVLVVACPEMVSRCLEFIGQKWH
ncbi:unnamed protein product [Symbiodinium sp. CCMP2592]|nr:unnamed protein product [Symbiodinium sp. CCMP2592]